ncbi:unnamed protein product [Gongylonema pulchrum]|uniref:DH domain-containing protein n=1 Tax=Gongylonema pulchrum TaxID=637853 RepID=A0A183E1B6_9BILA|nr:unnamed protein product [Gongylonema pulchrum]VDN24717.1 unnamed protein product [Gongylonema pulchrum]
MFSKHLDAYKKYQLEVVKLLLADANVTYDLQELICDLDEVIIFETEFARVCC